MPVDRAAAVVAAGHRKLTTLEIAEFTTFVGDDPDPRVRAAALAALVRGGPAADALAAWNRAALDDDARVRRRAAELAPAIGSHVPERALVTLLADRETWVAEAAAFALGERESTSAALTALIEAATEHRDPLVRESAVAALGALGDPVALPAILRACDDKPAVRRRAVLALAAFEGDEVEARIRAALEDRDWQVRQAAEDLLRGDG